MMSRLTEYEDSLRDEYEGSLRDEYEDSLHDIRRQCELPSPNELNDFTCKEHVSTTSGYKSSCLQKECSCFKSCSPRVNAYKNVLGISVSYFINFSAYLAVVGLQSSLNEEEGLGLVSLIVLYGCFIFSGLYTSAVIRFLGSKYTLLICYVMFLLYTLVNLYPQWYTLIPISVIFGLSYGPTWASLNVHIATIARRHAVDLNETPEYLIALFNGILLSFNRIAYLPGNLFSSIIFFSNSQINISVSDESMFNVCNNTDAANVESTYVYILLSVYVVMDIIAIAVLVLFTDHLGTDTKFISFGKVIQDYILKPILDTLKMFIDWKMLMILPMMILAGVIIAFAVGQFPKYFVSDCIGVRWIGVSQITFGIFGAMTAIINGRLVKCVPQYVMIYAVTSVNIGIVIFVLLWERTPSFPIIFTIIALWGICDGIWISAPPSLVGSIFKSKQEAAYGALRMGLGTGFTIGFIGSLLLDISIQFYILLFIIVCACITYSILLFVTSSKDQLLPCCFKKNIYKIFT